MSLIIKKSAFCDPSKSASVSFFGTWWSCGRHRSFVH